MLPEDDLGLIQRHVVRTSLPFFGCVLEADLIESLKLGNVWVFVQLIHWPTRTTNQQSKNPNIT